MENFEICYKVSLRSLTVFLSNYSDNKGDVF